MAIVCFSLVSLTKSCIKSDVLPELFVLLITSVQAFQFFFILKTFPAEFFGAKDNEFYASLPISSNCIFLAKFLKYYLYEFMFSALLITPFIFTVIGTALSFGKVFGVGFYFMLIPIYITTPLMPILLTAIFSLPINAISTFFKKKGTVSSILLIVLYLAIMAAYFFIVPKLETVGEGVTLSENAVAALKTTCNVFYFTKCEMLTALGIYSGKNFGIGISIFIVACALAVAMSSLTFRRSLISSNESTSDGKTSLNFRSRSKISALISRDFKQVMRVPTMALNTFATAFITPMFLIIMKFIALDDSLEGMETSLTSVAFVLMYSIMIIPASCSSAAFAFSREGKAFTLLKQLPVSTDDVIKSKIYFSGILSLIVSVLIMIVSIALYKISALETIFIGICVFSVSVTMSFISLHHDSKKPNFNWNTINEMSKSSRSQTAMLLPLIICIVFAIATFAFGIFLSTLSIEAALTLTVAKIIFWAVVASVALISTVAIVVPLFKKIKTNIEFLTQEETL